MRGVAWKDAERQSSATGPLSEALTPRRIPVRCSEWLEANMKSAKTIIAEKTKCVNKNVITERFKEDDIRRIQDDARKDGLMTALNIASETIRAESSKYATGKPEEGVNGQNTLSGLGYVVSSAILKEADALEYLPASNDKLTDAGPKTP